MLRLPPRRLDQLKALSAALNLSLADTVGHLVRKEIAAGTIPDTIPGIVVKRVGDKVSVAVDDHSAASYSLDTARKLATTIRAVIDGAPGEMNVMLNFGVIRRGTGMKLFLPLGGPETILSPDLASDLADLIDKTAS
jgi:hypothetical protein